jgi:hypothetical protein
VPGGIHFLYGRGEHNVCLAFLTELQVVLEISWIGIEILADPELGGINKDGHDSYVGLGFGHLQ